LAAFVHLLSRMTNVAKALIIFLLSVGSLSFATTDTIAPPVKENPSWMHTMEASLVTSRMPNSATGWIAEKAADKDATWLSYMGWVVAALFMFVLLTLNLRARAQQKTLLRGGEPDFFFLPPARDRRRRPR